MSGAENSTKRPFAVFDIDGTLVRWQLYHALADALVRQEAITPEAYETVRIARMNWKRRITDDSFHDYETALIPVFDAALRGLPVSTMEMAAQTVFSEHKDQVYIYTRELIADLKAKDYLLFAISGSPQTIVEKLTHYYGFDDFAATQYPVKNGYFTGVKDLTIGKKPELLRELIAKHNATTEGSIAVGDSEGDTDMLELAEQAIAFNPSKKLFQHAQHKGWQIVVERKNVIYNLAQTSDGHYELD